MTILGVDPGRAGAAALMDAQGKVTAYATWSTTKAGPEGQVVAAREVLDLLDGRGGIVACIEYPVVNRNRKAAITQGMGVGMLWYVLTQRGIPVLWINPRQLHALTGGKSSTPYAKMRGYPVETEHLADACCIAEWALHRQRD